MRKIDEMTLKEIQEKIRTNRIIIIKRYKMHFWTYYMPKYKILINTTNIISGGYVIYSNQISGKVFGCASSTSKH